MINEAKSGHPGIVLGAAPIIYTLYSRHMNINVNDEKWLNRDRFVLSAGHGSALLYATLYMAGYDITIDDLKHFRKIGFKTPGHPEYGITPGVDMSTGPLGQGFASAVGMAIAEKKLSKELEVPRKNRFVLEKSLINHNIYVLCGDGDLMEGVSSEAASIAGNLCLDNLIVLYDSNNVSLDGPTSLSFKENVLDKFKAMGWDTILVKEGQNVKQIDKAITKAKSSNKPTIIEFKTIIGKDSLLEGKNIVHGKALTKEDTDQLKKKLNVVNEPFLVDINIQEEFKKSILTRSSKKYTEWSTNYKNYLDTNGDHDFLFNNDYYVELTDSDIKFDSDLKEATRVTNKLVMKKIAEKLPNFIGGSADVASATNAYLEGYGNIDASSFKGRNIFFGVREHAMGAILNGLTLYNYRVFGSTFLAFSDYVKPAIRMSALLNLPVTYIFTHDSILVGEDGPTHQPVEQLAMLRATPNLNVYRPCDANELVSCWNSILKHKNPSCLILSRTEVPLLTTSKECDAEKGAYIVHKEETNLKAIIIATGTEVETAITVANNLKRKYDINIRVVSMPCMEQFCIQSKEYQDEILPVGYKKFVIEAGSSFGWEKFVYNSNYLFTINNFGISGPMNEVIDHMKFDYATIENGIYNILK